MYTLRNGQVEDTPTKVIVGKTVESVRQTEELGRPNYIQLIFTDGSSLDIQAESYHDPYMNEVIQELDIFFDPYDA